jgi:hypothetical protein
MKKKIKIKKSTLNAPLFKKQSGGVVHTEPKAPDKKGPFITVQKRNLKNK